MFKKSYRIRLLIIFLIITTIPLLFMGVGVTVNLRGYFLDQYNENMMLHLYNEKNMVDEWMKNEIDLLRSYGEGILLLQRDQYVDIDEANHYLASNRNHSPEFYNIFIILENGAIYNALNVRPEIDMRKRPWYMEAKKRRTAVISEPYEDIITGAKVVTISMPLYNSGGKFLGVVGGDLSHEKVWDIIEKISIEDSSEHIVFNENGKKIWACFEESFNGEKIHEYIDYERIKGKEGSLVSVEHAGKKSIGTYIKLGIMGWDLLVITDEEGFYEPFYKLMERFVIISIGSILIILLGAIFASKQIAKPLLQLRDRARDISMGKMDVNIETQYEEELGEVIRAFNHMAMTITGNYRVLGRQTDELMAGNKRLKEINTELEASYSQLEATTEQLNESEQNYQLLLENISDLVWMIDIDGNITYINDEIEHTLGYKKEEILGKCLCELICPFFHCKECSAIIDRMKREDLDKWDVYMLPSGSCYPVIMETNTKRIYYKDKLIGVLGIGRDVTATREMKEEIVKRNKELTLLNEISSSLTSTLSPVRTDTLLELIVDKVVENIQVSICTIRLLDHNNRLVFKATSGPLSDFVSKEPLEIDQDMIGRVVKEKRTIIINDIDKEDTYAKRVMDLEKIKHTIAIPLIVEDEVIGSMTIASENKMDDTNLNILEALSNHASVAIGKARMYEDLREAYLKTIRALAMAIEAKDSYTRGHSIRVSQYAVLIGRQMGLQDDEIEEIEFAGVLHDIGKIGISDEILTKPGRLLKEEFEIIKGHPVIAGKILEPIGLSGAIVEAVLLHHKRNDLKGYPEDYNIEKLPLYAQVIGVADAFDAMISNRSYKKSLTIEEAVEELRKHRGTQFSSRIVKMMEKICEVHMDEIKKISEM